jgi:hypothetical protein
MPTWLAHQEGTHSEYRHYCSGSSPCCVCVCARTRAGVLVWEEPFLQTEVWQKEGRAVLERSSSKQCVQKS